MRTTSLEEGTLQNSVALKLRQCYYQWRRNEFKNREHMSGAGIFLSCPSTFLVLHTVVLMSAFVIGSTVWSVSYLLFFYSRCPPCPCSQLYFLGKGGRDPRSLWSRRNWLLMNQ